LADRVDLGLELCGEFGGFLLLGLDLREFLLARTLGRLGRDRDAVRGGGLGQGGLVGAKKRDGAQGGSQGGEQVGGQAGGEDAAQQTVAYSGPGRGHSASIG